jgi:hypothetical protein
MTTALRAMTLAVFVLAALGCAGKPDEAAVEKKVKEGLARASPEWRGVTYATRAAGTVAAVGASRTVDGNAYWFSFTGGGGNGGVAVRGPAGAWRCTYRYEQGQGVAAETMEGGTGDDVGRFRAPAAEFAAACSAATS